MSFWSADSADLCLFALTLLKAAVYKDFDICVWSQTSWRWLELKLTELGILTNPNYQISFGAVSNASACTNVLTSA